MGAWLHPIEMVRFTGAFQVLLENSEPFKDLEAVSREGFKTILLAEQLLREAEAKDADCLSAVEFLLFRNACCVLVCYSTVVYRGLDYQKASTHLFLCLFVAFSSSTCDLFVDFSSSTAFLTGRRYPANI